MDTYPEIRERILAAAESLFEQSGRTESPSVEAVRQATRASMKDVAQVLRDWRREQLATTSVPLLSLRRRLNQTSAVSLSDLWNQVQRIAVESHDVAQSAWEAEKAEADALRLEISSAFDSQAAELDSLRADLSQLHRDAAAAVAASHRDRQERSAAMQAHATEIAALKATVEEVQRSGSAAALAAQRERTEFAAVFETQKSEVKGLRSKLIQAEATAATAAAASLAERGQLTSAFERQGAELSTVRVRLAESEANAKASAASAQRERLDSSSALEAQAAELNSVKLELARTTASLHAATAGATEARNDAQRESESLRHRAVSATARSREILKRARSLKTLLETSLNSAQGSANQMSVALDAERQQHQATRARLESVSEELATLKSRAHTQTSLHLEQAEKLQRVSAELAQLRGAALSQQDSNQPWREDEEETVQHAELRRFVEMRDRLAKEGKK